MFFYSTVDYADSYSPDKIHSQYDSIYDLDTTERENKAPLLQIEGKILYLYLVISWRDAKKSDQQS